MPNLDHYVDLYDKRGAAGLRTILNEPLLVENAFSDDEPLPNEVSFSTSYLDAEEAPLVVLPPCKREVFTLAKRQGATFSSHIGVGRTANMDVHVARQGISKFHAYFVFQEDGGFLLTDRSSTNGTFVNGERLTPGVTARVQDGGQVAFARHSFTLLSSARAFRFISSLARRSA